MVTMSSKYCLNHVMNELFSYHQMGQICTQIDTNDENDPERIYNIDITQQ